MGLTKSQAKRAKELAASLRYRIMSDDSGHEYFIPTDEETIFEGWLQTFDDDWDDEFQTYLGPDYEKNRIDGNFTFSDPKCE